MDERYLLVGLGNPGATYEATRHNLGFMIIDQLTPKLDEPRLVNHTNSWAQVGKFGDRNVVLAKPLTYMNHSGLAIRDLVDEYNISLDQLLIIADDFNLPFGQLRLRPSGSDGGHRGLASVIDHLETDAFPRLRVGIGQEGTEDHVDFVLGNFDEEEKQALPEVVRQARQAVLSFVQEGLTHTMNNYNRTTN